MARGTRTAAGLFAAALLGWPAVQPGAQSPVAGNVLVPGKGSELTMARCAPCHEIMHVTRVRLTRAEWQDNLKVMIARGAPLTPEEVAIIVDYLAAYYGRNDDGAPRDPPAPDPGQAAFGLARTAGADAAVERLLAAGACLSCHSVERRVVGPAFGEVAAKFGSDPAAAARLARKIRQGGAGVWGTVPMPPNLSFSDEELARLVEWVLSRKPG